MRNLKRALSLGLTAAMISGLMVMGSSAASYADVTSEDNVEAIEVLQAVGIMVGDENGDFNPDQNVTRNEMAVIMSNLMEYNVASYKDTSPFTDVPSWAEPYVAACWTNGITAGTSATTYGGSDSVTTAQAALMLMKALGYFQYNSDFGADWQLSAVKQGNDIDLFIGVDSGVEQAMTRNDVAQLVLNTLKAGTVQAESNGSLTVGNVTIATDVKYSYITSNQPYATAIDDARSTDANTDAGRSIVELGEQLYMGDLKLNDETYDVFGRPARYWEYDGDEIGTYAKTELLREEYTTEVTGKDLYDLLGKTIIDNYDVNVTIDGVSDPDINTAVFGKSAMVRANDDEVGDTGDGVLTQVYVNTDDRQIDIAIINTYLALADDDFDDRTNDVDVTVYGIEEIRSTDEYVKTAVCDDREDQSDDFKISADDFEMAADVLADDALLVTVANGEIQTVAEPEVLSAVEVSTFQVGGYVITDGTRYDFADAAEYEMETMYDWTSLNKASNLKDVTYDIYLDQYGYAIGVVEVDAPDNYLFITGVDTNTNNRYDVRADATAIFLDGTMASIEIDMTKADKENGTFDALTDGEEGNSLVNQWFTYTVNSSDVYTLDLVGDCAKIDDAKIRARAAQHRTTADDIDEISRESIVLRGGGEENNPWYNVYGNDESIYLTVEISEITDAEDHSVAVISDVENVVVGVDNANIDIWTEQYAMDNAEDGPATDAASHGAYTLFDDDGYVIAAVVVGEDAGSVTNLVYAHTGDLESESYDKNAEEYTWTRKVIFNGEETELTEVGDSLSELEKMDKYNWYEVKYNADGEVKSVELASEALAGDAPDEYVDVITDLNAAMNKHDTVLYEAADYNEDVHVNKNLTTEPSFTGRTFYVDTKNQRGFRVDEDVKIVFIQTNNNRETVTYDEGYQRLERVVDRLHESAETEGYYNFEVSAIMDNYSASVVIVRDLINAGADVTRPVGDHTVTANYDGFHTFTITIDDGCDPNNVEIADAIRAELTGDWNGSNVEVRFNGNNVREVSFTTANGTPMTLSVDAATLVVAYRIQLEVNGKEVNITAADDSLGGARKLTEIAADANIVGADRGAYAKVTNRNGNSDFVSVETGSIGENDVAVEFGYTNITDVAISVDGWEVQEHPVVPMNLKVDDTFTVILERTNTTDAYDQDRADAHNWTVTEGLDFAAKPVVTVKGTADAGEVEGTHAIVTVTLKVVSADVNGAVTIG